MQVISFLLRLLHLTLWPFFIMVVRWGVIIAVTFFLVPFLTVAFKSTYVSNELDIWVDVFDQSSLYTYTLDHDYDTTSYRWEHYIYRPHFSFYNLPHLSHDYKVDYFQNAGLNYLGTKREFISKAMFSDRTHTESFDQDVHYFRLTFLYKEPNDPHTFLLPHHTSVYEFDSIYKIKYYDYSRVLVYSYAEGEECLFPDKVSEEGEGIFRHTDIILASLYLNRLFFLSSDMELENKDQLLVFSLPNEEDDVPDDHFSEASYYNFANTLNLYQATQLEGFVGNMFYAIGFKYQFLGELDFIFWNMEEDGELHHIYDYMDEEFSDNEGVSYDVLGSYQEDTDWYDDDSEDNYEDEEDFGGFYINGEYYLNDLHKTPSKMTNRWAFLFAHYEFFAVDSYMDERRLSRVYGDYILHFKLYNERTSRVKYAPLICSNVFSFSNLLCVDLVSTKVFLNTNSSCYKNYSNLFYNFLNLTINKLEPMLNEYCIFIMKDFISCHKQSLDISFNLDFANRIYNLICARFGRIIHQLVGQFDRQYKLLVRKEKKIIYEMNHFMFNHLLDEFNLSISRILYNVIANVLDARFDCKLRNNFLNRI